MPNCLKYLPLLLCSLLFQPSISFATTTFETTFQVHSLPMLLIDPSNGDIIKANNAASQFYAYSLEKLESMKIQQINMLSPAQVATERKAAKDENRNFFIFRHKTANSVKTVQVHSSLVPIGDQELLFSIVQDISSERLSQKQLWHYQGSLEKMIDEQIIHLQTKSKQQLIYSIISIALLLTLAIFLSYLLHKKAKAEQKIKSLSEIVEQSPMSIAILDDESNIIYNKEFEYQQMLRKETITSTQANFIDSYKNTNPHHAEISNKMQQRSAWHGELLSIDVHGKEYWEYTNIYPLSVSDSHSRHVVISQDITHIKENEKELRLASAVFHTATEAVMICDAKSNILATNNAFSQITGYSQQEVIGKTPAILKSGLHDIHFYQQMFQTLKDKGYWQGEICNRRKNGELYYEWLSVTALSDQNGQLEAFVSLFSDISKRKKAEQKIYQQANFDNLTNLANRYLFSSRLEHCISVAKRDASQVAVFFIDLDGFKYINDNFGHSQGDILLKAVAKRLSKILRKSDTISRLGGDEFAVVLPNKNDIYAIEKVANKVINEIAKPYKLDNKQCYVTASVGVSIYPEDSTDQEQLVKSADIAMYRAKAKGRNNFQFFTPEMDDAVRQRCQLESELREAIKNKQLSICFQPIHHNMTGKLTYAEALVRWSHPEKGTISPAVFIPIAEEVGLINQIGDLVLEQACEAAANWKGIITDAPGIAINVSSIQFEQDDFVDNTIKTLNKYGLSPTKLIVEITESLLIKDNIRIYNQLNRLNKLGVKISLDDFGTGYSSLSYLKRFPVNTLKVDRSFIQDVDKQNSDTRLLGAFYSIAQSLQLDIVAEGVETEFQLNKIKHFAEGFIQGYIFSKPLTNGEFISYMLMQPDTSSVPLQLQQKKELS
ncbi:MAG: EAL domain-containing protein [Parashewanella sp.]